MIRPASWFALALLATGCSRGSVAVSDAGEGATGGRRDTPGTGGSPGTGGVVPPPVMLWEPPTPCSNGTSAVRSAQMAPPLPPEPPRDPSYPVVLPPPDEPGPAPLRRLTRLEYANTVRDLLGVEVTLPDGLALDQPTDTGFVIGAPITAPEGRQLMVLAMAAATSTVARLPQLLPACCTPVPADPAQQEACAGWLIDFLGRRAYRRPLGKDEGERLLAFYRRQREPGFAQDFAGALRMVIAGLLQSPHFLYHRQVGPFPVVRGPKQQIELNGYELASRLSYLLWASMPDSELFTAAANRDLRTPDQITKQAKRLLADRRSRAAIEDFHLQWMEVAGLDEVARPEVLSPELARSMLAETRAYVNWLFEGQERVSLERIYTSPTGFVDKLLAAHYGLPPVTGMQQVELDRTRRAGLLTQASVLAAHARGVESDPTGRGLFLLRRVACYDIPPPPRGIPPLGPGATARQRLAAHVGNPACVPCHQLTDPPGLAFERYDGLGVYRESEGGQPIDPTGEIELDGEKRAVRDGVDLAQQLVRRPSADCLALQWYRYFLRREPIQAEVGTMKLFGAVVQQTGDLRELLVAIPRSNAFRYRVAAQGETP